MTVLLLSVLQRLTTRDTEIESGYLGPSSSPLREKSRRGCLTLITLQVDWCRVSSRKACGTLDLCMPERPAYPPEPTSRRAQNNTKGVTYSTTEVWARASWIQQKQNSCISWAPHPETVLTPNSKFPRGDLLIKSHECLRSSEQVLYYLHRTVMIEPKIFLISHLDISQCPSTFVSWCVTHKPNRDLALPYLAR